MENEKFVGEKGVSISKCLDITDEQFEKMTCELIAIIHNPESFVSDKLLEIKDSKFSEIEKIYMGFLMGGFFGEMSIMVKENE